jgi:site-specific DNA recombinase
MARLALYLRRSDPGEDNKNYSIEDQRIYLTQEWPEFQNHELLAEYCDPGGKSYTLSRPAFNRMMEDARARKFDLVAVWMYDRFSRMQDQQSVAIYQLKQYGVEVVSATQPIPEGPVGTLIRNSYAFGAELMLYRIREGTYRGKKRRVKDNKLPNAALPTYGYEFADATKARYVIDKRVAPIVRRIFSMALAGVKLREIARTLTAEGVPTPSQYHHERGWPTPRVIPATIWSHATTHKILTNTAYVGRLVGFRTLKQTRVSVHPVTGENIPVERKIVRDESDPDRVVYGEDVCPRLIDDATFDAVQAILARNKVESQRRLRNPEALLLRNGFAKCAYCDGNMVATWSKAGGYYLYRCSRNRTDAGRPCPVEGRFSWRASTLDDLMWRAIIAVFERPEVVAAKYAECKADKADGLVIEQDRLEVLKQMLQDAENKRLRNTELASNEEDDDQRAEYQRIATEAARSKRGMANEMEALRDVLATKERGDQTLDNLAAKGERAVEHLKCADFDDKRRTLLALVAKLYVRRKGDPDAVAFECRLSERFDPTTLSVQSHFVTVPCIEIGAKVVQRERDLARRVRAVHDGDDPALACASDQLAHRQDQRGRRGDVAEYEDTRALRHACPDPPHHLCLVAHW